MSWMAMSGGARAGWAFYLGLPSILQIFLTMQAEEQIIFLTERQQVFVGNGAKYSQLSKGLSDNRLRFFHSPRQVRI